MSSNIEPLTILRRRKDILSSQIDDEIILLDSQRGCYYGLNFIGASIWTLLQEPKTVAELTLELIKSYDISEDRCHEEVMAFIEELEQHNLLTLCS